MEDGLLIVSKLQKLMRNNLQIIGDTMITGGVDNMEKYKYLLGQANTYQIMLQEISNLLENKEQKNDEGTIIDLNSRVLPCAATTLPFLSKKGMTNL